MPNETLADDPTAPDVPPLAGVRVLDFTRYVAGPYCTMLLADHGAEVIKVEPPEGEHSRRLLPMMSTEDGAEISTYFLRFNRGKKSVVLSPKMEADRAELERLIASADVLVENFRPGVLESWGWDWDELQRINPRLVYASVSGFGHTPSPCRDWPAFNLVAEVMAGVVSQSASDEQEPRAVGLPVGDSVPSLHALAGILLALLRRQATGRGSRVDIAMFDSMLSINEISLAVQSGAGLPTVLGRMTHDWFAPFGLFKTADGWLCIAAGTDGQWTALCRAAGLERLLGDSRLKGGLERSRHFDELIREPLDEWLRGRNAEEAAAALAGAGVPAAPVLAADQLLNHQQALARDMVPRLRVTDGAQIQLAGNPIRVEPRRGAVAEGFPSVGQHDGLIDELPRKPRTIENKNGAGNA